MNDTYNYPILYSGFRTLPTDATVMSGLTYNCGLHAALTYNQELIERTLRTKQLVNDYYPPAVDDEPPWEPEAYGGESQEARFTTTASGIMAAQWGPFQYVPDTLISGEMRAKAFSSTGAYPDEAESSTWTFTTSPTLQQPRQFRHCSFSGYMATVSGTRFASDPITLGYDETSDYAWYPIELVPDPGEGDWYYVAMWGYCASKANSASYISHIGLREVPIKGTYCNKFEV